MRWLDERHAQAQSGGPSRSTRSACGLKEHQIPWPRAKAVVTALAKHGTAGRRRAVGAGASEQQQVQEWLERLPAQRSSEQQQQAQASWEFAMDHNFKSRMWDALPAWRKHRFWVSSFQQ